MQGDRCEINVKVEDANEDMIGYLLENLYGLEADCESNWNIIGGFIEKYLIELSYYDESQEWNASIYDGDMELTMVCGSTPCMAVSRLMVKKLVMENPDKKYALRMPLLRVKSLFDVGDNLSLEVDLIMLESSGVAEQDLVELVLLA